MISSFAMLPKIRPRMSSERRTIAASLLFFCSKYALPSTAFSFTRKLPTPLVTAIRTRHTALFENRRRVSPTKMSLLGPKNMVSVRECVDANKLAAASGKSGLAFLDGSWYHKEERNGRAEFEAGPRIAGARYVDMEDIATTKEMFPELNPKGLPVMLPPKRLFAAAMDALGIQHSDHIVVYGKEGSIFTPRTWFLFRMMGHDPDKIHILQGSFENWMEAGGEVETGSKSVFLAKYVDLSKAPKYKARDPSNIYDMCDVLNVVNDENANDAIILDSRGTSFGKGHIPGAIHVPYSSLVLMDNQLQFKDSNDIERVFLEYGVDVHTDKKIIISCGSGVSVCHVYLALEECGRNMNNTFVYDGSWSEWGSDPDTPKQLPS